MPYKANFLRGIKPEVRLQLAEWAAANCVLSAENTATPGKFRPYPFQVEILNAISNPAVEKVTVMKSARVGYTTIMRHALAYYIAEEPCPIMVVHPTLSDSQSWSKTELAPMLRDTEKLRGLVKDPRSRDSGNTVLQKEGVGFNITLVGANSPTGFRRSTIRVLLMDELSAWPPSAGLEGDQEKLAEMRTQTFWNRKIIAGSTPTVKGLCRIERRFEKSDQRQYFVPCPECQHFQTLKWSGVVWPEDDPDGAAYACEGCGSLIPSSKKLGMLQGGEWRPTNEEGEPNHVGFRINALYSLHSGAVWGRLAREFLEAKRSGHEALRGFINLVLGETWDADSGEGIEGEPLYQRREEYEQVPKAVLVVTAAVDVQGARLEVERKGWAEGEESWGLGYRVIIGDPGLPEVWAQLDDYLLEPLETEDGRTLTVAACCIDSGGHHTQTVYDFVQPRQSRRVFAIKGVGLAGAPIVGRPRAQKKRRVMLLPVGTDAAKDLIYSRLKSEEPGAGYFHFPKNDEYDGEYFEQLSAERAVQTFVKGVPVRRWKQTRARNEALDITVYNLAAVRILNPNWDKLRAASKPKEGEPAPKPKPRPKRGGGWKVSGWG